MYCQEEQFGKSQVERANQEAIEKKIAETRGRLAALHGARHRCGAVSSRGHRVAGRPLPAGWRRNRHGRQQGCQGTPRCRLPGRRRPVSVAFGSDRRCSHAVRHRREALGTGTLRQGESLRERQLPHPALAAPVGGPLAVKAKPETEPSSEHRGEAYELLAPTFLVKAELQPEQSVRLHAGQLTTVAFQSSSETVAFRIFRLASAWMQRQMAARQTK